MILTLTTLHFTYIICIIIIIGFMICKKDTSLICILSIFAVGFVATSSFYYAISGIFSSFIEALNELSGIILIISVIASLCKVMEITGINERMVSPLTRFITNPTLAFWIIGIVMFVISTFFWPTPAVALIGAIFLPVALKAKLPAIGVAVSMNLFGHGFALSGDFIIQGAPKLAADGANIELSRQISASVPLVIVMGVVTTITAYLFLMKDLRSGRLNPSDSTSYKKNDEEKVHMPGKLINLFAVLVPLCFAFDLVVMVTLNLQGDGATTLIGGTALLLLIVISIFAFKQEVLEPNAAEGETSYSISAFIEQGFISAFKVFGSVIPIAAFFYLGDSSFVRIFGEAAVPAGSLGLVNDLGFALSTIVPVNETVAAFTSTTIGAITGLDGSGFSGISLAGSIAKTFSVTLGKGAATLSALGQISAIWVGGGTIIPYAVISVATICDVEKEELVARNLVPVLIGLFVTTIVGIFLI